MRSLSKSTIRAFQHERLGPHRDGPPSPTEDGRFPTTNPTTQTSSKTNKAKQIDTMPSQENISEVRGILSRKLLVSQHKATSYKLASNRLPGNSTQIHHHETCKANKKKKKKKATSQRREPQCITRPPVNRPQARPHFPASSTSYTTCMDPAQPDVAHPNREIPKDRKGN